VYNVFKSADSLSIAYPIYIKIEMWAVGNVPYFGITVGTGGTNGSGSLLSPTTNRVYGGGTPSFACYIVDVSAFYPCFASGDSGSIRFGLFNQSVATYGTYNSVSIIVARSRDGSGNQTGDYVMLWTACNNGKTFQTVFTGGGGANNEDITGSFIGALPSATTSTTFGGVTMASPVFQNIGGLSNPTPDLLVGKYADFAFGSSAAITVYNVSHNYISVGSNQVSNFLGSNSQCALLLRYE
jgi:hypothetical protein